jgi:hypothetical protein
MIPDFYIMFFPLSMLNWYRADGPALKINPADVPFLSMGSGRDGVVI